MQRRDFLKSLGAAGVASMTYAPLRAAERAVERYEGPLWMTLCANGGWDTTCLFDPRPQPISPYVASAIRQTGCFTYGPYAGPARTVVDPRTGKSDHQDFFQRFFETYASRLTVINGIDVANNSHTMAKQHMWGGRLDTPCPSFAALAAAASRPDLAMAFLSTGDYEVTHDLVGISRPYHKALDSLGDVNRAAGADAPLLQRRAVWDNVVRPAIAARLQRQAGHSAVANQLWTLRSSDAALRDFHRQAGAQTLHSSAGGIIPAAEVSLVAFAAGLAVSANLTLEGFDTHANHTALHYPLLDDLLRSVDFIMVTAERLGIAHRLNLVVGSEFTRAPGYNDFAGKDHWPVGALMMLGPAFGGGRIVGGTHDDMTPQRVDAHTLQPNPNGIVLTPAHVHAALQKAAGIPVAWRPASHVPALPMFAAG